jgi:hypothetical protein
VLPTNYQALRYFRMSGESPVLNNF